MFFYKSKAVVTFLLIISLINTSIPFFSVAQGQTDITPPQLTIFDENFNTPDPEIIVHGRCIDESGTQNVTINGELATGWSSDIHYSWQKKVSLNVGVNTIVVRAYDNSPNHNEVKETFTITYRPTSYFGPTVEIVPVTSQPSNNATVQCKINPNGGLTYVYLWASYSNWEDAPFNWGRGLETYSGTEEILVSYTFDRPEGLDVGTSVSYIFRVRNSQGTAFTEVETFEVTEPIYIPDTEPPEIIYPNLNDNYNTPNSIIPVFVQVSDNSGIKNVTINGELATGTYTEEYFFGYKNVNLDIGTNTISVVAYDNSLNNYVSHKKITVNYQPLAYLGPTIDLLLPTNITSNTVSLNCVVNPNGTPYTMIYLYYAESYYGHAPFAHGLSQGTQYSGSEDIPISYHIESDNPEETILFMFFTRNSLGTAFTEIMKVTLKSGLVNFDTSPTIAYANCSVDFNAAPSFSPFGEVQTYEWNFGDGNTTEKSTPSVSHVFEAEGTYNINLTVTDEIGFCNSTTIPLTILADSAPPVTTDNYDEEWHNADFSVTLTPIDTESGVAETFYQINDGFVCSLSADGQPLISIENASNKLEYWSVDNVGNVEDVQTLTGIKLDTTNPTIGVDTIYPESDIQSGQDVTVTVPVLDSLSGVDRVILEYSIDDGITWDTVQMVVDSTMDVWTANIPGQQIWTNVLYKISAIDIAGNIVITNEASAFGYEVVAEFSYWIIFPLFVIATIVAFTCRSKLKDVATV